MLLRFKYTRGERAADRGLTRSAELGRSLSIVTARHRMALQRCREVFSQTKSDAMSAKLDVETAAREWNEAASYAEHRPNDDAAWDRAYETSLRYRRAVAEQEYESAPKHYW